MMSLENLDVRLQGILRCIICRNLPKAAIYQCMNGHLVCPGCLTHLLTEAELVKEQAVCPWCRCSVSRHQVCRNIVAELAAAELPAPCRFCRTPVPRRSLEQHELELCDERITECCFARIGCGWQGPYRESAAHEKKCCQPKRPGAEILQSLLEVDQRCQHQRQQYGSVFELLSTERITFHDIQLIPYRSDGLDVPPEHEFLETCRFSAFNNQWRVEARLTKHVPNMTYQLVLASKERLPCVVNYLILQGPYGDFNINPRINKFHFSETNDVGPVVEVTFTDPSVIGTLGAQPINFRIIMFLVSK